MSPAIRVRCLADARWALAAARSHGGRVTLASAPGAASFAGPGWWRALIEIVRSDHPGVPFTTVLDCGDAAGDAMASLREGVPCVRFSGRADVAAKLRAMAAARGAAVVHDLPPALDLDGLRDPALACRVWLRDDPVPVIGRADA